MIENGTLVVLTPGTMGIRIEEMALIFSRRFDSNVDWLLDLGEEVL